MPASRESLTAALAHRRTQLQLRAGFTREFLAVWPVLDKANVAATSPDWIRLAATLIRAWRSRSARVAALYLDRASLLDTGVPAPRPPDPPSLTDQQIVRNLLATGPGALKRARLTGLTELEADRRSLATVTASASRLVLDGGRSVIEHPGDRRVIGWARLTDGDPCAFCAMLASRGAVYRSEATATGELRRYHDGCGCTPAPAYTRAEVLPEANKRFAEIWAEATAGLSGADARRAFRAAIEDRAFVPSGGGQPSRPGRRSPGAPIEVDPARVLAVAEETIAGLERRAAAGEDVAGPLAWQRGLAERMRRRLAP